MVKIAPSILSADFGNLQKEIRDLEDAGADLLHLDIMDGHFVPNITFGPMVVSAIDKMTSLILDVHLMIDKPENYLERFVQSGADWITFHWESTKNHEQLISRARGFGVRVGCSLRPRTPFQSVRKIMGDLDLLLLMTVNPGFGGQDFLTEVLPKISQARKFIQENNLKALIQVDGGINSETSRLVQQAGADILVAGEAIFRKNNYKEAMDQIRQGKQNRTR